MRTLSRRRRWVSIALLMLLAPASHLRAAPGDLDPTFGGGFAQSDFPVHLDQPQAMATLADGGVVVAGGSVPTRNAFAVARYDAAGLLATTFGGDGLVTTEFPNPESGTAFAVAAQADDKIVVAGRGGTFSNPNFVVIRYEADGDPDSTFGGGDGIVTFDLAGNEDEARAVIVEPSGAIIVVGWSLNASFREVFTVLRLEADGDPDPTFGGGDGVATADFGSSAKAFAAARRSSDGAIVVAGTTTFGDFAVARFENDGDPDGTFSTDGRVTVDLGNQDGAAAVFAPADGTTLVIGETRNGGDRQIAVARLEGDGDPDPGFGPGTGKIVTDIGPSSEVRGGTMLADGRIVAIAQTTGLRLAIARYTSSGDLDPSFGTGGVVETFRLVSPVAVVPSDTDGLLVALGFFAGGGHGDFGVARFDGTGALDRSYGDHGRFLFPIASNGFDTAPAVVAEPDGHIVVGGTKGDIGPYLARFDANGVPDATFGGGDGVVEPTFGTVGALEDLLRLPDGRFLGAGTRDNALVVARFEADGDLDLTFGGGTGIVQPSLGGTSSTGRALARQANGAIIVAGTRLDTQVDIVVVRIDDTGTVDGTFGGSGVSTIDFAGNTEIPEAVLVEPDDKIVIAGRAVVNGETDVAVARLDANGTLDGSFGSGGRRIDDLGGDRDGAWAIVRQSNGRLVVAGLGGPLPFSFALVGYDADGMPDASFGTAGRVFTVFPLGESFAQALLELPDGTLLAGGNADGPNDVPGFALARYTSNGSLDSTFGADGVVVTPFNGVETTIQAMALTPDGTLVASGQGEFSNNGSAIALAEYRLDGFGTTTTTLPEGHEQCGNCVDDDGDGLTDFEDASCCTTGGPALALRRGNLKPVGGLTKLALRGTVTGGTGLDPTSTGLTVQLKPAAGAELLCARLPAASFKRKGKAFRFVDKKGLVATAGGLTRVTLKSRRDGSLALAVVAKRAGFITPSAGSLAHVLGFGSGAAPAACTATSATYRPKKKGVLVTP